MKAEVGRRGDPGVHPETWLGVRHAWNLAQQQTHQAIPEDAWFRPLATTPGDPHPGAYDVATALLTHAAREAATSPGAYDKVSAAYISRSLELGRLLLPGSTIALPVTSAPRGLP